MRNEKKYLWISVVILFGMMCAIFWKYDVNRAQAGPMPMCVSDNPGVTCDWNGWMYLTGPVSGSNNDAWFCCNGGNIKKVEWRGNDPADPPGFTGPWLSTKTCP